MGKKAAEKAKKKLEKDRKKAAEKKAAELKKKKAAAESAKKAAVFAAEKKKKADAAEKKVKADTKNAFAAAEKKAKTKTGLWPVSKSCSWCDQGSWGKVKDRAACQAKASSRKTKHYTYKPKSRLCRIDENSQGCSRHGSYARDAHGNCDGNVHTQRENTALWPASKTCSWCDQGSWGQVADQAACQIRALKNNARHYTYKPKSRLCRIDANSKGCSRHGSYGSSCDGNVHTWPRRL